MCSGFTFSQTQCILQSLELTEYDKMPRTGLCPWIIRNLSFVKDILSYPRISKMSADPHSRTESPQSTHLRRVPDE